MSNQPDTTLERERLALRRPLTLGTRHNPLEVPGWLQREDGDDRLALVAALALRGRFDRPAAPESYRRINVVHDPDRMPDVTVRSLLRRLGRQQTSVLPAAVSLRMLDVVAAVGYCLHPFDYGDLSVLMKADPTKLDPNAAAWLNAHEHDTPVFELEMIDAENWLHFGPAERARFLRELRAEDPATARELLEAAIGDDTAAVRGRLIDTLATGLGPDDIEFLQSQGEDRAASVKKKAAALLARIEGTDEQKTRLASAHEYLEVTGGRIIGRRRVVKVKVPKGTGKVDSWIEDTFGDVNPRRIAAIIDLDCKKFAAALGDRQLQALFFINALAADDRELAELIGAELDEGDVWWMASKYRERIQVLDTDQRRKFWDCIEPAMKSTGFERAAVVAGLVYETIRMRPTIGISTILAKGKDYREWAKTADKEPGACRPDALELLVALSHGDDRTTWRERFTALPPVLSMNALALADLFDALDAK